jgi:hypothetical protein
MKQEKPKNKNVIIRIKGKQAEAVRDWFAAPLMPYIHFDVQASGSIIRIEFEHPGPADSPKKVN